MRDAQMNLIKLSLIHSLLTGSSRENAVVGRGMSVSKSYCVSGRWSTWPSHLTLPLQWTATYCLPFPAQVGTHLSNTEGELRERAEIVQALNNMQAFQWARLYEADTTSGQGRLREITRGLMSAEKISNPGIAQTLLKFVGRFQLGCLGGIVFTVCCQCAS